MKDCSSQLLTIFLVAICLVVAVQSTEVMAESEKQLGLRDPTFTSEYLKNGMLVSIYEDQRMPVVTVQLVYNVGSAHEDEDSRGLAHLFEHLMFSATEQYPERAVFKHVEQFGGSTNATTSFDETNYYALVTPDRYSRVLEIYADRMVNLVLTEEAVQRDKKIVLEELRVNTQNDPINRLGFEAIRVGFGGHPYAISPLGTEEDVSSATVASCKKFYEKYYGPKNAHLIVVGAVESRETFELVELLFGEIEKEVEDAPLVPLFADWDFPEEINLTEDIPPFDAAAFVYALPPATSEVHDTINLMITMLAGFDGFEDELVRKRGKALFAQSVDLPTKSGRILAFGSVALPYRRKEAAYQYLAETLNELARFEWLNEQSLAAVKRRYLQTEYRGRYTSATMARRIVFAHGWQDNTAKAFDREQRINAVQIEDIKEAYRRYILALDPTKIYVEPQRVPWYITVFGRLYPIADKLGLVGSTL